MSWIFTFIKLNVYDLSGVWSAVNQNLYLFALPMLQCKS